MPDVHLPHLDEPETHHTAAGPGLSHPKEKKILKILLEVVLISVGVFLGLAGEQWRASAERRDEAQASLRRFRTEILANQKAVAKSQGYHAEMREKMKAYLALDPAARKAASIRIDGVQVVFFEHTAWDLALATQALANVDSDLAFALSRIYQAQAVQTNLANGLTQAMYIRPPSENPIGFLASVLPKLDRVLEE